MDSDLIDAAAEAPRLALKIGAAASDLACLVVDIGQDFPLIYVVIKTLKNIRDKMETIKTNQELLDALHQRCACITACVIVKCRRSPPSEVNIAPLVERIEEVHKLVERFSTRTRISRVVKASRDRVEIVRMHERIGDLTDDMGLAGILAVERDVSDLKGLLETVDTKQDEILTRLQKPPTKLAKVPKGTPARKTWHVKRQRVIDTVCESLFREGGPHHVGLVGESGSGKTTAASEIVRSADVQEFFSDGIVWLSVDEGAKARLPSLMLNLAKTVHADIGGSLGRPPTSGSSKGGAGFIKELMDGRHNGGKKLRCLLVVDNVWDKKVVSRLRKTGMWMLTTSRDERLVEGASAGSGSPGEAVVIDEMSEEDAESVLIGASELPAGSHLPEAAKEVAALCGHVAMDLAFVGRWSTTRGRDDPLAWSEAADKIRAELEEESATEAGLGGGVGAGGGGTEKVAGGRAGVEVAAGREGGEEVGAGDGDRGEARDGGGGEEEVEAGAGGGAEVREGEGAGGSGSDHDSEDNARAKQRRAILRAGFDHLGTGTDDDRVQRLYLSLAVIPDGHAFSVRDAAALLYDREGSAEDEEAVGEVVETLERWAVLRAVEGKKYRMHDAHSSFARESLMDRENVRGPAVARWVEHISSLGCLISLDTFATMGLWWALERVGGDAWRWGRPYEKNISTMADSDPLCRESLSAVARFRSAKGDWPGEKVAYERLLRVERKALGPHDPTIVSTLWHLGNCAERMENPQEAKEWRQREYETVHLALAKIRAQDGVNESEQSTADGLRSLASGMLRLAPGRLDEAEKLLRRAVEIEEMRLGPNDIQLAGTLHQLGVCVREAGRKQEAEAILRRVLEIKESKLGPANVYVAVTLHELGVCVRQTGRVKEAELFLRRALDIWQGKLGLANGCIAYTTRELRMCVPKGGEGRGGGGGGRASSVLRMSRRLKSGGRGELVLLVLLLALLAKCMM